MFQERVNLLAEGLNSFVMNAGEYQEVIRYIVIRVIKVHPIPQIRYFTGFL